MHNRTTYKIERLIEQGRQKPVPMMAELILTMQAAGLTLDQMVTMVREDACFLAWTENKGNQSKAAAWLGVHRNTSSRGLRGWINRKVAR
jgi:transcriptional regulator of acetoin/glycerol metabolism